MPSGFPQACEHLQVKRFAAGMPFREDGLPKVASGYLRVLFSQEYLIAPIGYALDGEALSKIEKKTNADEETRSACRDLLRMLSSDQNEATGMALTLKKNGSYYYPHIQTRSANFMRDLYYMNLSQTEETADESSQTSPEVLKAANKRLQLMVGSGMILTSAVARNTLRVIDEESERKKQAAKDRDDHAKSQKHLWLALLSKLVEQNILPQSTELEKDALPAKALQTACSLLNLKVRKDGKKVVVANRLVQRLGIPGTLSEYSPPNNESTE